MARKPVGYLIPVTKYGYSTMWDCTHPDTMPVSIAFRCWDCCQPCDKKLNVSKYCKPIELDEVGPLTTSCQTCGRSVEKSTSRQVIERFLALPSTALPCAVWQDSMGSSGSPWNHLRDYVSTTQCMDHMGETVILSADRDDWRDGITVELA